jgi:hypothetical protein
VCVCVCVSLFYVIDTGSIGSRARYEMGVAYLPFVCGYDGAATYVFNVSKVRKPCRPVVPRCTGRYRYYRVSTCTSVPDLTAVCVPFIVETCISKDRNSINF